jgi:hypothetical protein
MFEDEQNQQPGQVPGNLPIGEPEDIFGGVDTAPEPSAAPAAAPSEGAAGTPPTPPAVPSSALDAGVLKPKVATPPSVPGVPAATPPPRPAAPRAAAASPQSYQVKSPSIGRGIVGIVIALVVVAILGGGGWWIYNSFIRSPEQPVGPVTTTPQENLLEEIPPTSTGNEIPITETESEIGGGLEVDERVIDEEVLFGEPIDRDADGLDDVTEESIGTDPNNWDTDGDELSDGDEAIVWETDPLNPDTDGDGFSDGAEVKNGYSPVGPGRIFEAPTSTP